MIDIDRFRQAIELINKSSRILLTTHSKPDGDACGCVAALCEVLTPLGKQVQPLFLSEVPAWYQFLLSPQRSVLGQDVSEDDLILGRFGPFDLVILVDVNSDNQLPGFERYLKQARPPVLVVDHHVTSDGLGTVELVDAKAAAAGLVVLQLVNFAGWVLTPTAADALFVAIATDTGWFQFRNTDAWVYRQCAALIDAGARPAILHDRLYHRFSIERFNLMRAMLNSLEILFDGRFALQSLRQADFARTGATYEDTENLINECHRIGSVRASALLVELADGCIRGSFRSRSSALCPKEDVIDVSAIAASFGGGGHKMAAGSFLPGPLEEASQQVVDAFAKVLSA